MAKLEGFARWQEEQKHLDEKLGCRGHGEKLVQDALDAVYATVRDIDSNSVHGNDEEPGLYGLLEQVVTKCAEAIPGDEPYFENRLGDLASIIGIAFDLGKHAAGAGTDLETLQRQRYLSRQSAIRTANMRSGKWQAAARPIFDKWHSRISDQRVVEKICDELEKRNLARSSSTVLKVVKRWKKATPRPLLATH